MLLVLLPKCCCRRRSRGKSTTTLSSFSNLVQKKNADDAGRPGPHSSCIQTVNYQVKHFLTSNHLVYDPVEYSREFRSLIPKSMELDAVGPQYEPSITAHCVCMGRRPSVIEQSWRMKQRTNARTPAREKISCMVFWFCGTLILASTYLCPTEEKCHGRS